MSHDESVLVPKKDRGGSVRCGFRCQKAPCSMGKISVVGVLRLRAPNAVSRKKSVRRSAQDDDFAASWRGKKPASSQISHADSKALTFLAGGGTTEVLCVKKSWTKTRRQFDT